MDSFSLVALISFIIYIIGITMNILGIIRLCQDKVCNNPRRVVLTILSVVEITMATIHVYILCEFAIFNIDNFKIPMLPFVFSIPLILLDPLIILAVVKCSQCDGETRLMQMVMLIWIPWTTLCFVYPHMISISVLIVSVFVIIWSICIHIWIIRRSNTKYNVEKIDANNDIIKLLRNICTISILSFYVNTVLYTVSNNLSYVLEDNRMDQVFDFLIMAISIAIQPRIYISINKDLRNILLDTIPCALYEVQENTDAKDTNVI